MYLVHETTMDNLLLLLKDGEIKSNQLTGKINNGDGVYDKPNKFVYFAFERFLFANTTFGRYKLYFSSDLLYNRDFYLSTVQSPSPDVEQMWMNGNHKELKIKYKRYTNNINKILDKFYYFNDHGFAYGQIAIKNKINIHKYLVAIQFVDSPTIKFIQQKNKIINIVKKKYPNILIKEIDLGDYKDSSELIINNINKETIRINNIIKHK